LAAQAIRGTADLAVDNLDVESVFSSDGITEEDLRAGKYDSAGVWMFLVNYRHLGQGILKLRRGWLGEAMLRSSSANTGPRDRHRSTRNR
jgi:hypothetical protein